MSEESVFTVVFATSANIELIAPALRSAHVFCKEVELPVPSESQRGEILQKILHNLPHELYEEDILKIAGSTHGFVGADLRALCTESALYNNGVISLSSITHCLKSVRPSALKSILVDVPNVSDTLSFITL
jgi:AAA family ATPase